MKFTVVIDGHPDVVQNLHRLQTVMTRQGNLSAWNQAQHLFARTRAVVPYRTGKLYESAYYSNVGMPRRPAWQVGYDTNTVNYAVRVHETPGLNHPIRGPSKEPKQDHFLSEPRDAMVKTYPRTVADDMEQAIKSTKIIRRKR